MTEYYRKSGHSCFPPHPHQSTRPYIFWVTLVKRTRSESKLRKIEVLLFVLQLLLWSQIFLGS